MIMELSLEQLIAVIRRQINTKWKENGKEKHNEMISNRHIKIPDEFGAVKLKGINAS